MTQPFTIRLVSGADANTEQLTKFKKLLLVGGQIPIAEEVLDKNLKNAEYLAFYIENEQVIGIGAIKNPQKSYRRKTFEHANVAAYKDIYPYEIGYFVTLPEHLGKRICQSLLQALMIRMVNRNMFATTKSVAMKNIFLKKGFKQFGQSWTTESGNVLELYTYTF